MLIKTISQHITLIDAPFHGKNGMLGTYLIKADKTTIIDPGPTAVIPYINRALKTLNISQINHIIPTHIHLDHAGGTWKLMETFPSATAIVHPRGWKHFIDPNKLEKASRSLFGDYVNRYGEIKGTRQTKTNKSNNNQEITLGEVTLKILWTPGHASHHQCVYIPENKTLIAGDAAGRFSKGIIMPTTPPPFNPIKAIESLNQLIDLSPEIICYGHFGYSGDAVEKLKDHREQIKTWLKIIEENWGKCMNLNKLYKEIQEADPYASRTGEANQENGERSQLINLQGFINYVEWEKTRH